jgi:glutamyl-tRNA reductase
MDYKNWCLMCQELELTRAKNKLLASNEYAKILEDFSHRLINKYLDPIYQSIYLEYASDYDKVISNNSYRSNYLNKNKPKADHIEI